MANTTLDEMQLIEEEVNHILQDYDQQIAASQASIQEKLTKVADQYDQETQVQVANLEVNYQQERQDLQMKVDQTIADNQAKIDAALTDRKADLIRQIVEEVVEKYGN
ncbi:hypothetical protein [Vaginisenegalia massiliensis]|uniref:hypothetical protein n=1 Tax=Vaginisenegalia massiliensis TaxID=2058294 RepID=UPI000F53A36C|nr:hypothetical protein [Vaginisenegalia massiliensis]